MKLTIFLFVITLQYLLSCSLTYSQVQQVTDDIFVFKGPNPTNDFLDANASVIFCDKEVFVVDATLHLERGKQIADFIKEKTSNPVKYVFVTHWHYDHSYGIQSIQEVYPGLEIISTKDCKKLAESNIKEYQDLWIGTFEVYGDSAKAELSRGTTASGRQLTEYEKERRRQAVKDCEFYIPVLKQTKFIPPTITFEKEMDLFLSDREIRMIDIGTGHTPGDAVAYLPSEKILFAGDLLVYPIPYAFSCYPNKWLETLKRMSLMDIEKIIPGHGDVLLNKDYLFTVISALEEIISQVNKLVNEGKSLQDVRKGVDFTALKTKMAGEDESKKWAFDNYFIYPIIERVYNEAKGEL